MEKIFVTGGAGFIGSNLVEYLADKNQYEIVVYDNLKSGFEGNIKNFRNLVFIKGDVLDYENLKKCIKGSSKVFHFAAEVSVPESMKNPVLTEKVNTEGTINLLNAMLENNVKSIVFASSAAIYGDSEVCPKKVDMPPNPISPYAISKLSGEHYVSMYSREYGFNGVVARFFNVYGERQNPNSQYAAAIPIFLSKAIRNQNITIFGDGFQTRDFIYVKDLVKYIFQLSSSGSGIYNIGYGKETTINDLADMIIKSTYSRSKIVYLPKRAGDVKHSFADVSKLKELGNIELVGFEQGLKNTIKYFKEKG